MRTKKPPKNQGQWFSGDFYVEAEKMIPQHPGEYIIEFDEPIGRVYKLDGTVEENIKKAFIRRGPDGTITTGYPILNNQTLSDL